MTRRFPLLALALVVVACGAHDDAGSQNDKPGTTGGGGSGAGGSGAGGTAGGPAGGAGPQASGWPIGIPAPEFGVDEQPGPSTHYVDSTHPACSDAGDGTPENPRCDLPRSLPAGSVVEIHGGPYTIVSNDDVFTMNGTAAEPVFFVGVDAPMMDGEGENRIMRFSGSYYVVQGLHMVNGTTTRLAGDHYALRDSEVDSGQRNCVGMGGDHGLLLRNELHHCHSGPNDRHGVQIGQGTSHNWVIFNDIHHNAGNGIQYTHNAEADPPDFVFIGGNEIHHDREVGIATKWAGRTVVSQNHIHHYGASPPDTEFCMEDGSYCMTPSSGSNGPGIVFGADGFPEEKWVIHNVIHDTNHCVRIEDSVIARVIGNLCLDIGTSGVSLEKSSADLVIANNSFVNVAHEQGAVIHQYWRDEFAVRMFNNLVLDPGVALWFEATPVIETLVFDHNLLFDSAGSFEVLWKNDTVDVSSLAELNALMAGDVAQMVGNQVVDPGVTVDRSGAVPRLQRAAGSPTLDAGDGEAIDAMDDELKATFGSTVSLRVDAWIDGVDIGSP
jgi:hypothetical protein